MPQREDEVRFSFSEALSIRGWMAPRPVQGEAFGGRRWGCVAARTWQREARE